MKGSKSGLFRVDFGFLRGSISGPRHALIGYFSGPFWSRFRVGFVGRKTHCVLFGCFSGALERGIESFLGRVFGSFSGRLGKFIG